MREAQLREVIEGAKPREAKRREDLWTRMKEQLEAIRREGKDRLREAPQVADASGPMGRDRWELPPSRTAPGDLLTRPLDPRAFPVVSIGQPEVWGLSELYPLQHMPPLMQAQLQTADFYVIRLFCSFRPVPGRARVGWARFHVLLLPDSQGRQPIAYDISPVDITREVKRQLKFTVAPMLKFQWVEAEVGKVEVQCEYPELQPISVGAGIGEAIPTWDYQVATGMIGIQGVKWMHLLIKAPKGMPAATAQLALTAQIYVDSVSAWIPSVAGPAEQSARLTVPLWPRPSFP